MALAHPMSLLSHFQPGMSLQVLHLRSMTTPMPTDELASEKAPKSQSFWGPQRLCLVRAELSTSVGHLSCHGECGVEQKTLVLNMDSIDLRLTR